MKKSRRRKPAFWKRHKPAIKHDIAKLRPATLPRGQRFETLADTIAESQRSEGMLRPAGPNSAALADSLQECREGDYRCERPTRPICAREFRRWLVSELLRLTEGRHVKILTVLLAAAGQADTHAFNLSRFGHMLRKRLATAGLADIPVIGGYEIVYRAKDKQWVLHINLVVIGGKAGAINKFKDSFSASELDRPVMIQPLVDPVKQLSYVLKFSTFHRPNSRKGAIRQPAVPLNRREHCQLVGWMAQQQFQDFLLLFNARRRGSTIVPACHD
jgi:hypothetical protein